MLIILWMVFSFLNCQITALNNLTTLGQKQDELWLKNGTYNCYDGFCKHIDYKKPSKPSKNTLNINIVWSYGNLSFSNTYLKEIDARKMVLKYEPSLIMTWRDHRFKAKLQNPKDLNPLDANIIREIWTPDLYITNQQHSTTTNNKLCM